MDADSTGETERKPRGLPVRHYIKNGSVYYVDPLNKWHRLGRATDPDVLARVVRHGRVNPVRRKRIAETYPQMMRAIFLQARKNAKSRGILYLLSKEQETALIQRANGRCEISGIEFSTDWEPGSLRRPFVPSLDRIDARGSYSTRNCRIVCCIVNAALADWGEGPLRKMVAAMSTLEVSGAGLSRTW